eukprot:snap_masked-scaffold197_size267318-processed-gene-1.12 protein:Tk09456 transcript:snap_masked-scaffold197_size267318-processed-gene-1.12-mRNA-1 annotation:"hypothetical protein DAPPUDRAFT_198799"
MRAWRYFKTFWKTFVIFLVPLFLLPLPILVPSTVGRCGYVVIIMAAFWVTEALPLPVTSLIPMVLFPFLGIMPTNDTAVFYLNSTNFMFIGGLIMAIAIEKSNLHERLALKVLTLTGSNLRFVTFGFMAVTAFLSMWISNTAATAMMLPIIDAVVVAALSTEPQNEHIELNEGLEDVYQHKKTVSSKLLKRTKNMLHLSIMYSANIGGTGTVTGSPSNLVVYGVIETIFGKDTGLNFATWMAVAVPGMIVNILIAWAWLQIVYLPNCFGQRKSQVANETNSKDSTKGKDPQSERKNGLRSRYEELGPISWREIQVAVIFVLLIAAWITRSPRFIEGWSSLLTLTDANGQLTAVADSTVVILAVLLLFVLPAFPKCNPRKEFHASEALISWRDVQNEMQWGVIILVGGGFAMAEGAKRSCLSYWMGSSLEVLKSLPQALIVVTTSVITAFLTEFMSNTATANLIMPVLAQLAIELEINPMLLMLMAGFACCYAFMLPVATPPNAIIYSSSDVTLRRMILMGVVMNILTLGVSLISIHTLGNAVLGLSEFPDWANHTMENSTGPAGNSGRPRSGVGGEENLAEGVPRTIWPILTVEGSPRLHGHGMHSELIEAGQTCPLQ